SLKHAARRQLVPLRQRQQCVALRLWAVVGLMFEALLAAHIDTRPRFAVERRGANETFERASPECLGLRQVLPSEPFDIVPVRTRLFQLELASFRVRPIEVQYFLDNQIDAPAVEQAVMKAPVKV